MNKEIDFEIQGYEKITQKWDDKKGAYGRPYTTYIDDISYRYTFKDEESYLENSGKLLVDSLESGLFYDITNNKASVDNRGESEFIVTVIEDCNSEQIIDIQKNDQELFLSDYIFHIKVNGERVSSSQLVKIVENMFR